MYCEVCKYNNIWFKILRKLFKITCKRDCPYMK